MQGVRISTYPRTCGLFKTAVTLRTGSVDFNDGRVWRPDPSGVTLRTGSVDFNSINID